MDEEQDDETQRIILQQTKSLLSSSAFRTGSRPLPLTPASATRETLRRRQKEKGRHRRPEAAALRTGALASHLGAAAAAKATPARPPITTHVLDTALGRPAAGVRVRLLSRPRGAPAGARAWVPAPGATTTDATSSPSSPSPTTAAAATTDADGRCSALLSPGAPRPPPGVYRIEFDVGEYFERTAREVPGYGGGGAGKRLKKRRSNDR